jgi:TolB-like protein
VHEVRQAIGQEAAGLLRTLPRRGYLLAADPAAGEGAAEEAAAAPRPDERDTPGPGLRRDGIAVLPPSPVTTARPDDVLLLDGVAHDIVSRLARLRSFHVIARASAFALRHLAADPRAAGRLLGVAHVVTGTADMLGARIRLCLDLVQVETGSILWTEDLVESRDRFLTLLPEITDRIVHAVELRVAAAEARRALAMPAERRDAWEHFHAGLHHALRFDPERIGLALDRMQVAVDLDPAFARAHAGKSFCHYFRAFSGIAADRAAEIAAARRTAEEAILSDETSPSALWACGRALWLQGDPEGCLAHCQRSVAISPGFALGHYMVGFVETHCGDPGRGLAGMDHVLSLSPFDPFLASIQITKAIALVRLGRMETATETARQAARQPNAHAYPMLLAPAALILASAGHVDEARRIVGKLRETSPGFGAAEVNRSLYRMSDEVAALFRSAAPLLGL